MKTVLLSFTLLLASFNAECGPKYGSGGNGIPTLYYGPVTVDGCDDANSQSERIEIIRTLINDPANRSKWYGGVRARKIPGSDATYSGVGRLMGNISPNSTGCVEELARFLEDENEIIRVLVAMTLCDFFNVFGTFNKPLYTSVTDSAGESRATDFRKRIKNLIEAEQKDPLKP